MEKIPLYLDRKFVTFIGFRFFFKDVHFLFKTLFILLLVVVFYFGCTVWLVGSLFPYQSEIEPVPSAVGAWSPNRWATREFPESAHFQKQLRRRGYGN